MVIEVLRSEGKVRNSSCSGERIILSVGGAGTNGCLYGKMNFDPSCHTQILIKNELRSVKIINL